MLFIIEAYYPMIMQFSVKNRDGASRLGELLLDKKKIITPNILFIDTNRFKAPSFADIILTNKNPRTEKPTLKVLGSLFSSSKHEDKSELQVSNYLVHSKDLPKNNSLILFTS